MFDKPIYLPSEFDYLYYRKPTSLFQNETDAVNHFHQIGKPNGDAGSPLCYPNDFVRFIESLNAPSVLEIGPGCAPRMRGDSTRYFDVKSRKELLERYAGDPNQRNIPDCIHYVNAEGNLRSIPEKFDIVFSSHMIEHTTDIIAHINDVHYLLNPNGLYCVIVPDRRFTFDFFKPISLMEDAVCQHLSENSHLLSLRAVLSEAYRRAHNSHKKHWDGDHGEMIFNNDRIMSAIQDFEQISNDHVARSGYHNWVFTDDSFSRLIYELHEIEMIPMEIKRCFNTPRGMNSFCAILGRPQ